MASNHHCHYIIHTQHDCSLPMNSNFMRSVTINSLSLVNLLNLLLLIKVSFIVRNNHAAFVYHVKPSLAFKLARQNQVMDLTSDPSQFVLFSGRDKTKK